MKKYLEFGFGNRWLLRTEFERPDGTEYEGKGWIGPIKPIACYLRIWVGRTVVILDSREGLKYRQKSRKAFKWIWGIRSKL